MADRVSRVRTPTFLQNVSLGFARREYVADRLAPVIPVTNQSGKYRVWGKNNLLQHEARWAPGAIPNAIETRWSEATYFAEIRKLRTLLLDAEVRNADTDLNLRQSYTEVVTGAIEIAREARVATLFTTAANYPGANTVTKAGAAEWDTLLGSNPTLPRTDIDAGIRQVVGQAMVPRNQITVAIPEPVYDLTIRFNATLLGMINYTTADSVQPDMLARLFGVKEVLIVQAMTTGAGPEVAGSDVVTGFTNTYLWLDNVWIGLVNDGQNDMAPSFARTFNWTAETAGQRRQIRQYRAEDEGREADWIECKEAMSEAIVYSGAGYLIKNTLAAI